MVSVVESVTINKPVQEVFAFITDRSHIEQMSDHVTDVAPISDGPLAPGSQYSQTRLVHGRKTDQVVTVRRYETNALYVTETDLFGFSVTYTYQVEKITDDVTKLTLTKAASGHGWIRILTPLLKHLLTRPEHDGHHLQRIQLAVEAQAS